jgi:hypothetical protein
VVFAGLVPKSDCRFAVIVACLENTEIIINAINTVYISIFFAVGIVSQPTNCSPNLVAESLAFSDHNIDMFFCQSGFERLILGDFPK